MGQRVPVRAGARRRGHARHLARAAGRDGAGGELSTAAIRGTRWLAPGGRRTAAALAFTVAAAAAFAVVRPPVGDFWAAEARRSAALHGVGLHYWFAWFDGTVPGHYSVLAPYLVRFFDVAPLGAAATVVAVLLCRALLRGTRYPVAGTWFAAVGLSFSLWSGRIPFAAGTVLLVAALIAVRDDRRRLAVLAGIATPLISPVSGAFLALGLVGVLLHDRERRRTVLWTGGATCVTLGALGGYFGMPGSEGFRVSHMLLVAIALALMLQAKPPAFVRTVLIVSLIACPLLTVIPNGMGTNFERFAWIYLPVAVAATGAARRAVVLLVAVTALSMGVIGSLHDLYVAAQPMSTTAYSDGLVATLDRLPNLADYRTEVVPDGTHVAAYALLDHATLARGYETQSDNKLNGVLRSRTLDAAMFRTWLDENAVAYVALDRRTLLSGAEDRLVRYHRPSYLHQIWSDAHWQLFAVASPTPIAAPPATVVDADQANVVVFAPRAGTVPVRLRWSSFLHVTGPAGGRILPDGHGWSLLVAPVAGRYTLTG